ncbi:MAG: hypothetical protein QGF47_13815, partial [Arenicellales bacterium]|nr:hypothetical protein [Arenicellales bacterium]
TEKTIPQAIFFSKSRWRDEIRKCHAQMSKREKGGQPKIYITPLSVRSSVRRILSHYCPRREQSNWIPFRNEAPYAVWRPYYYGNCN